MGVDALQGAGERILVVEDQDVVRMLASDILTTHGYIVMAAGSAAEALAVFEREGGRFDLVFSDVILPDLTGLQLVDELERRGTFAALFASGYADEKTNFDAGRGRRYRFLQKPYDTLRLLQAVHDVLAAPRPGAGA